MNEINKKDKEEKKESESHTTEKIIIIIILIILALLLLRNCNKEEKKPEVIKKAEPIVEVVKPVVKKIIPKTCKERFELLDVKSQKKVSKKDKYELNFKFDSDDILPESLAQLTMLFNSIAGKDKTLIIEGYADARGSKEYNTHLGARRIKSVQMCLSSLGFKGKIIQKDYGEEHPKSFALDKKGFAKNRRVIIKVD